METIMKSQMIAMMRTKMWFVAVTYCTCCASAGDHLAVSNLSDAVKLRIKHSDLAERNVLIYTSSDDKTIKRFAKWFSVKKSRQDRGDWAPDTFIYFIKPNGKARILYVGNDAWSDGVEHEWPFPSDFKKEFEKYLKKERKNAIVWNDLDPEQADPPEEK
jgi:hypothetical protein